MVSFTKKDLEVEKDRATPPVSGIVFQVREVEALMTAAENIALNIKSRIAGASQVIFKNLKQEHQFEAFTESIGQQGFFLSPARHFFAVSQHQIPVDGKIKRNRKQRIFGNDCRFYLCKIALRFIGMGEIQLRRYNHTEYGIT